MNASSLADAVVFFKIHQLIQSIEAHHVAREFADHHAEAREALKALIERESARRLARLKGYDPKAEAAPRRRPGV